LIYWVVFLVELYKIKIKNKGWEYCYKNNVIYSYSDLILCDLKFCNIYKIFILILIINIFYLILIFQLALTLIFIVFPVKVTKRNKIFNIFIYIPFLYSKSIKKLCKMIIKNLYKNKIFYKILFLNFLHVYLWGFPRICFDYGLTSLKIMISYEKNPNFKGFQTWYEIISVIYQETYESLIEKLENKL